MIVWLMMLLFFEEPAALTLDEAMREALLYHRGLQRARIAFANQEARMTLVEETYRWQFGHGFDYSSGEHDGGTFRTTTSRRFATGFDASLQTATSIEDQFDRDFQTDYDLRFSLPLGARFGRRFHEKPRRDARRSLENARDGLNDTAQDVIFRVVQTYTQILLQERLTAITEKRLQRVTGLLEATTLKLDIGRVSQVDLYRVRLLKNRTELDLARRHAETERLFRDLADITGRNPKDRPPLLEPTLRIPKTTALALPNLLARYTETSRYRALSRSLKEAGVELRLAENARLPDVELRVDAHVRDVTDVFDFGTPTRDEGVTASLSQRFDFNRRPSNIGVTLAQNNLRQTKLDLLDARLDFERRVLDQIRNLSFLEEQVRLSSEARSFAENKREVASARFSRGLVDNFDLIEAEEEYLAAVTDEMRTRRDLILNWLRLEIELNQLEPEAATTASLLKFPLVESPGNSEE